MFPALRPVVEANRHPCRQVPHATDINAKVSEIARYERLFSDQIGSRWRHTDWKAIMVDLFQTLLGHRRLPALVLAIAAIALLLPAHAEASNRSGGASPDAAPAVRFSAHSAIAHRAFRPARANAAIRPANATRRTALSAHPAAAPVAPPARRPSPLPDAWPGRPRATSPPVARQTFAPAIVRPAIVRGLPPAGEPATARVPAPAVRPWHPVRPRIGVIRRQIVATSGTRDPVEAAAPAKIAAPRSHPLASSLPSGGAEASVSGVGAGSATASAAALLGLTALALLGVLLPGLLGLDASPFRSAFFALRPERPG